MKKFFVVMAALLVTAPSFAFQEVRTINKSSFTATNDATAYISGTGPSTDLRGVVVSTAIAGGALTIFDGQGANATTKIAVVDLGTVQAPQFNVVLSSGLTYTTTGNTKGVTLLYHIN